MTAFIVSHPHVAPFATGVARGLADAGKLSAYLTGIAFSDASLSGRLATALARRQRVVGNRVLTEIPANLLVGLPAVEIGARLSARILRAVGFETKAYDPIFVAHDAAVALWPWPRETTGVYAYEDGALLTFRRAARRGLSRVWDLPLPHYLTIERILSDEYRRWTNAGAELPPIEPPWKRRRKDEELALATKVSVASEFTRQSLGPLELRAPIVVTPYGFPVEAFAPKRQRPLGPFTVLSVGTHDLRKGTPYLLEAWKQAAIPDAELHLVGPLRLAKAFLDRYAGTFRHWPHVPKADLGARYLGADLLAFPTLGDGFGIVIQESMCCGTPVVTTPCGGGPECITDGVDGYLVPPRNVEALVARFREAATSRERLYAMGRLARARAERWTWKDAGCALVRSLET